MACNADSGGEMTNGAKLYSGNFTSKGLSLSVLTPRPNSNSYAARRSPTVYKKNGSLKRPVLLEEKDAEES